MLTDEDDLVVDPFGGSCATGEAAERTLRQWICCDMVEAYLKGALGRFQHPPRVRYELTPDTANANDSFYKSFKPNLVRNQMNLEPLPADGGAKRPAPRSCPNRELVHAPANRPNQMTLLEPARRRKRRAE